jgi:hypothetical protein
VSSVAKMHVSVGREHHELLPRICRILCNVHCPRYCDGI